MTSEDSRRFRRGAALLTLGVGSSGVLTYAYFALASHQLEPDRYGTLVVLWSVLFIAVVTLYRPVEQYISRSISEREANDLDISPPLRRAATIQLALAALLVVAALLLRAPIEDDLLDGQGSLYAIFVVAAPAYAMSFFARGYLAGRRLFGLYGAMLLLESTSRFSLAVIVVIGLASGASAIALGIAVAPIMSLTVVPLAFVRARSAPQGTEAGGDQASIGDPAGLPDATDPGLAAGRFVGSAFLIMLSEQALLNVGVLVASVAAGSSEAGFLFNMLLIARAPQVLFMAVTTSLLPSLTRLRAAGGAEAGESFRREVLGTCGFVAGFAAAAAVLLLAAGPQLMQLTFGDGFEYDRGGLLIVVAGMGFHLISLTLTQAGLAGDRAGAAAARWGACAIGFVVFCLLPVLDEVRRVEVGYALATAVLAALLLAVVRPTWSRRGDFGSPDARQPETQARAGSSLVTCQGSGS